MNRFFILISNFYHYIFELLDSYKFTIGQFEISILGLIVGCLILSMVVTYFWKGVRG